MSVAYMGHHRARVAEVRVRNRADRLRRHDMPTLVAVSVWWAAVADWARIPLRNLRLRANELAAWWTRDHHIPICQTCVHDEHRACGWFLDDPACGCHCPAAAQHRIELAKIEGWGN